MGDEGGVAMAEIIEGNKKLQRLDLRRNDLGIAGLMAIRLSMKTNQVWRARPARYHACVVCGTTAQM